MKKEQGKMKTLRYILLSVAVASLASACSDDLNPDGPANKAEKGDEVRFTMTLPGADTRTIYGDENTVNKSFPIYWVNGDKVRVASPQCLSGRNSAEYEIAVKSATQNYATSMTPTGENGVQWGDAETADFYSIYPSSASTKLEVSGNGVTTTLHVDATQFASTSTKSNGTSDYFYAQPAEMGNVVMYAKTAGVTSGSTVELHYTPFSTVLEFEINASGDVVADKQTEITIQSLTLTAPTETTIAGDFGFTFPTGENTNPSIEAATGGSNTITMHFLDNNKYTTVLSTTKTQLKAKMCLMPISGVKSLAGWTVAVNTSAGTFSKTLTAQTGELKPGLVHKIKLPTLNYASKEWVYNTANWITSLPDYTNIYLSEISLPGAWYAGSSESYQATTDIATLWNAGVRAFAVETRTYVDGSTALSVYTTPIGVSISGTGLNSSRKKTGGTNTLNTNINDVSNYTYVGGTSISSIIQTIANKVKDTNEYAVLVLSYADGGNGGHRAVDYGAWLHLISEIYSNLSDTYKNAIYNEEINANTTVNDVKGKLILKINVDTNIAMSGTVNSNTFTYDNNLPALFSYNPFLFQMSPDTDANGVQLKYKVPFFSNLSWSLWGDDTVTHRTYFRAETAQTMANPFLWCFSSANRTQADTGTDTSIPTYAQRKAALAAMGDYSKAIYDASTHNVWFYFNCGGTEAISSDSDNPSPTNFATKMNPWLLSQINGKTNASPLGIVMFNQCTSETYNGPAIVKAIIEMNSKFYLKHAGTSGGSTGGTVDPTAQNDGTVLKGGEAI